MQPQKNATDRSEVTKVANRPKNKMPISERAKQFMPFSALKGLDEAIAKKEQEHLKNLEANKKHSKEL